MNLSIKNFLK